MELKSTCLVIADISGYTRFVMLHTTSLLAAPGNGGAAQRSFSSLPDTRLSVLNRMSYAVGRLIPVVIDRVQRVFVKER